MWKPLQILIIVKQLRGGPAYLFPGKMEQSLSRDYFNINESDDEAKV